MNKTSKAREFHSSPAAIDINMHGQDNILINQVALASPKLEHKPLAK
jgi:hypothetical protein